MASGASSVRRVERILKWRAPRRNRWIPVAFALLAAVNARIVILAACATPTIVPRAGSLASTWSARHDVALAAETTAPRQPTAPRNAADLPAGHIASTPETLAQTPPPQVPTAAELLQNSPHPSVGHTAIAFVIDLRAPDDATLQRVISQAIFSADGMRGDSDWIAVFAIGSALRIEQELTSDHASIVSALQRIRTRPRASTDGAVGPFAACQALSRRQQDALTRIQVGLAAPAEAIAAMQIRYFHAADDAARASVERRQAALQCAAINVSFTAVDDTATPTLSTTAAAISSAALDLSNGRALYSLLSSSQLAELSLRIDQMRARITPPPTVGLSLRVAPQTGCPLTLIQATAAMDGGYAFVTLRNDGTTPIRSVTLAVIVHPADAALGPTRIFMARHPGATVAPGERLPVASELIDRASLEPLTRQGGSAELGVAAIEFADGSTWTYDVKTIGHW